MKFLLSLVVLGVVSYVGYGLWYSAALRPLDDESNQRVVVMIPTGTSLSVVSDMLEEKGLIRSAIAFQWFVTEQDLETGIQAGSFALSPSMSAQEILNALQGNQASEAVITIPEGRSVQDIDDLLAEKGLIAPGAFVACANECPLDSFSFLPDGDGQLERGGRIEGYIFPDTYFVDSLSFDSESFIQRMLTTFRSRIIDEWGQEIADSGRTLHEIIIMASLIEKEAVTDEERPIIAGILWKRLDSGISLGVDATVRYFTNNPTGAITRVDLDDDSPYNTRKFTGLPPGPIANPGLASVRAAIQPQSTPYLYYLHDSRGAIHYARTNDEHNANRAQYLR